MKTEVQLTSKQITIDDLKNTDHVGFVYEDNVKGYIVCLDEDNKYRPVSSKAGKVCCNRNWHLCLSVSLKDAINFVVDSNCELKSLYRFDTRKELYQWLAED